MRWSSSACQQASLCATCSGEEQPGSGMMLVWHCAMAAMVKSSYMNEGASRKIGKCQLACPRQRCCACHLQGGQPLNVFCRSLCCLAGTCCQMFSGKRLAACLQVLSKQWTPLQSLGCASLHLSGQHGACPAITVLQNPMYRPRKVSHGFQQAVVGGGGQLSSLPAGQWSTHRGCCTASLSCLQASLGPQQAATCIHLLCAWQATAQQGRYACSSALDADRLLKGCSRVTAGGLQVASTCDYFPVAAARSGLPACRAVSDPDRLLFAGEGQLHSWAFKQHQTERLYSLSAGSSLTCLSQSTRSPGLLALGCADGTVVLLRVSQKGTQKMALEAGVSDVQFDPLSDSYLLVCHKGGQMALYELQTLSQVSCCCSSSLPWQLVPVQSSNYRARRVHAPC